MIASAKVTTSASKVSTPVDSKSVTNVSEFRLYLNKFMLEKNSSSVFTYDMVFTQYKGANVEALTKITNESDFGSYAFYLIHYGQNSNYQLNNRGENRTIVLNGNTITLKELVANMKTLETKYANLHDKTIDWTRTRALLGSEIMNALAEKLYKVHLDSSIPLVHKDVDACYNGLKQPEYYFVFMKWRYPVFVKAIPDDFKIFVQNVVTNMSPKNSVNIPPGFVQFVVSKIIRLQDIWVKNGLISAEQVEIDFIGKAIHKDLFVEYDKDNKLKHWAETETYKNSQELQKKYPRQSKASTARK